MLKDSHSSTADARSRSCGLERHAVFSQSKGSTNVPVLELHGSARHHITAILKFCADAAQQTQTKKCCRELVEVQWDFLGRFRGALVGVCVGLLQGFLRGHFCCWLPNWIVTDRLE